MSKEKLKSFSIIYIILAVLYIGVAILVNAVPNVANGLKTSLGESGLLSLTCSAVVYAVLNLWYFWLARRVASGQSKGTFYMILLILGVISHIVSFFTMGVSLLNLDAIVEIMALIFVLQVRKEG